MTIQILSPSFAATNVIEKCDLLPIAAFNSEWYELDQIEKKSLLMFITRSLRPFVMWAGEYYQMSLDTFIKVSSFSKEIEKKNGFQKSRYFIFRL